MGIMRVLDRRKSNLAPLKQAGHDKKKPEKRLKYKLKQERQKKKFYGKL